MQAGGLLKKTFGKVSVGKTDRRHGFNSSGRANLATGRRRPAGAGIRQKGCDATHDLRAGAVTPEECFLKPFSDGRCGGPTRNTVGSDAAGGTR